MLGGLAAFLLSTSILFSPPSKLIQQADSALQKKSYEKAKALAEKATRKAPDDPRGWLVLGLAQFRIGDYEASRKSLGRAVELAPDLASARFSLGSASFQSGHFDEAETEFLDAALVDPALAPMALLDAGFAAIGAGKTDEAEAEWKNALALAANQSDSDSKDQIQKKAAVLKAQIDQKRRDDVRKQIMQLAKEGKEALESGDPDEAIMRFQKAHALASRGSSRALEKELGDALQIAKSVAGAAEQRWSIEVGVGGGYDSNVIQSGIVLSEDPTAVHSNGGGSPLVSAHVDASWRPWGSVTNGVQLEYSFSQLAYVTSSKVLDAFSVQEHNLSAYGTWSPHERVTLELEANGFFQFTGIQTFTPFAIGASIGPHFTFREPHGFVTRIKYEHTFKHVLANDYAFLSGDFDDVSLVQAWQGQKVRVSLGYAFHYENVDYQQIPDAQDVFADVPAGSVMFIPFAYMSHEASLGASVALPWSMRGSLTAHYEHRDYNDPSLILYPDHTGHFPLLRRDDRYSLDAALVKQFPHSLTLELGYTGLINTSNIDNTNASPEHAHDYDDKNFVKHLVELELTWSY